MGSLPRNQPWLDVTLAGRAYKIQPLGCEAAFELDSMLLSLLGDSAAAAIASGIEGILPALLKSATERFEVCVTVDDVRAELAQIMDNGLGDIDTLEWIGRILASVAPKVADLARDTLPRATEKLGPTTTKHLVKVCVFDSLQAQDAYGNWFAVRNFPDLDIVLDAIPQGTQRQVHKWMLLIACIRATWGPSGAADTTPRVERPGPGDETSSPP